MAAYRRVDGLKSPGGWLPVHRDQLRAQHSVTSIGERSIFLLTILTLTVSERLAGQKFLSTQM